MTATTKKATSKYTAKHVAAMKDAAPLSLAVCIALAETPLFKDAGITARGIGAKARTEGIDYIKVEPKSKTGEPVADKGELAARIATALGLDVEKTASLAKAEKATLRLVADACEGLNS